MKILVSIIGFFRFLGSLMGGNPIDDCRKPEPVGFEFRKVDHTKGGGFRIIVECKDGTERRFDLVTIEKERDIDWNEDPFPRRW